MKTEIDWSKAPEWAKKLGTNPHGENAWLGDEGYSYLLGNGGVVSWSYETAFAYTAFKIIEVRPAEWSGEGLPPVGTVCEHFGTADHTNWIEVQVIGHGHVRHHDVAFFEYMLGTNGYTVSYSTHTNFRPLRTPEQIAAEERETIIKEMQTDLPGWIIKGGYGHIETVCAMLHDAGYRKQASND